MPEFVKVASTSQIKINESISVKAKGNFIGDAIFVKLP